MDIPSISLIALRHITKISPVYNLATLQNYLFPFYDQFNGYGIKQYLEIRVAFHIGLWGGVWGGGGINGLHEDLLKSACLIKNHCVLQFAVYITRLSGAVPQTISFLGCLEIPSLECDTVWCRCGFLTDDGATPTGVVLSCFGMWQFHLLLLGVWSLKLNLGD